MQISNIRFAQKNSPSRPQDQPVATSSQVYKEILATTVDNLETIKAYHQTLDKVRASMLTLSGFESRLDFALNHYMHQFSKDTSALELPKQYKTDLGDTIRRSYWA